MWMMMTLMRWCHHNIILWCRFFRLLLSLSKTTTNNIVIHTVGVRLSKNHYWTEAGHRISHRSVPWRPTIVSYRRCDACAAARRNCLQQAQSTFIFLCVLVGKKLWVLASSIFSKHSLNQVFEALHSGMETTPIIQPAAPLFVSQLCYGGKIEGEQGGSDDNEPTQVATWGFLSSAGTDHWSAE